MLPTLTAHNANASYLKCNEVSCVSLAQTSRCQHPRRHRSYCLFPTFSCHSRMQICHILARLASHLREHNHFWERHLATLTQNGTIDQRHAKFLQIFQSIGALVTRKT